MSNKTLLFTLVMIFFSFLMSCNDHSPGKINLEITAVSPDSGSIGTEVTISGSGFVPKASDNIVRFNDTEAQVMSVTAEEIVAKVPVGATSGPIVVEVGKKEVTGPSFIVTGGGGENGLSISSLDPKEGPVGTEVTITGTNFSATADANTVKFGNNEAQITSASETELSAVVPDELSPGDVVSVSVTVGTATATGPDFTVTEGDSNANPPSISGINPSEGPVGTDVTITGTNFSSTASENTVAFNGTKASINAVSPTEIIAVVPEGATTGPVAVTVNKQTAAGPDFTVTGDDGGNGGSDKPSIGGIDPTEGPVGTEVTITGENFSSTSADNSVTFGGTEATINAASKTKLVVIVPNSLSPGKVSVEVTVNGQSAVGPDFTVIDDDGNGGVKPKIDNLNPTEGPVGTEVTITGSNFGATAAENTVKFGGTEASVNSASSTKVVAVVPDGLSAGSVDVTITTGGQTATAPESFTVTAPAPVIDAIDPTSGTVGTEVTITGKNFSSTASENTVTFDGSEATVNSASETTLVAVVPNNLSPGAVAVEVTVNGQTAAGPDFTILEEGTPEYPIVGSNASITFGDRGIVCAGCGITNETNVIDSNTDNYAQVEISLGVAGSYYVSVESAGNIPAGGEAGFVIARNGGLIGVDLLKGITITTYLDGAKQESATGMGLLNLELVSGSSDRQFISFQTGSEFDQIEIEFGGLAAVSGAYELYAAYGGQKAEAVPGPVINSISPQRGPEGTEVTITGDNFSATASENTITFDGTQVTNIISASQTELVVEVPTGASSGPVEVLTNGQTGTSTDDFIVGALPLTGSGLTADGSTQGICIDCDVTNASNVVDNDRDNYASMHISVGVAGSAQLSVENTAVMPGGGQAGFTVSRSGGILDVGVLDLITIKTYLNGSLQESKSGSNLLLLDLLSGASTDRKFIGFQTIKDFDEIVISSGALVGADITYQVYGIYDDYFVTD